MPLRILHIQYWGFEPKDCIPTFPLFNAQWIELVPIYYIPEYPVATFSNHLPNYTGSIPKQ
jgi:hypothetical protein